MKIIDAHLHFSQIQSFTKTAEDISLLDYSKAGLEKEFRASGVVAGIGMGLGEVDAGAFPDYNASNPMLLDLENNLPENLTCCVGINPMVLGGEQQADQLARIEQMLTREWVVGIKIYAGYYPYYVSDPIYTPIYQLASDYELPVVIHGGATYARNVFLKYSHPLQLDEVAVKYSNLNFVIAHLGDPWVFDTAAIVAKNPNIYADLSGLLVKDAHEIATMAQDQLITRRFQEAIAYTDDYTKFLFGSDWPLAPISAYISFVKGLIPESAFDLVFYENALRVFSKLEKILAKTEE